MRIHLLSLIATAAAVATSPVTAQTKLCLSMVGDTSFSFVGPLGEESNKPADRVNDWLAMRDGMIQTLEYQDVRDALLAHAPAQINYVEFDDAFHPRLEWRTIETEADITGLVNDMRGLQRTHNGGTKTIGALKSAEKEILACPGRDETTRLIVDVATDDIPDDGLVGLQRKVIQFGYFLFFDGSKKIPLNDPMLSLALSGMGMNNIRVNFLLTPHTSGGSPNPDDVINYFNLNAPDSKIFVVKGNKVFDYRRAYREKLLHELSADAAPLAQNAL